MQLSQLMTFPATSCFFQFALEGELRAGGREGQSTGRRPQMPTRSRQTETVPLGPTRPRTVGT